MNKESLISYIVPTNISILECANIIATLKTRAVLVSDYELHIIGLISEGDIFRALLNDASMHALITPFFNKNFAFLDEDDEFKVQHMKKLFLIDQFTILPILDKKMYLKDIYTLKDYLKDIHDNKF